MKENKDLFEFESEHSKAGLRNRFNIFFIRPFKIGALVFSIFFSVILFTKLITYLTSIVLTFNLNIYDVLFSLIGFGVGFLIEFSLQIRKYISHR